MPVTVLVRRDNVDGTNDGDDYSPNGPKGCEYTLYITVDDLTNPGGQSTVYVISYSSDSSGKWYQLAQLYQGSANKDDYGRVDGVYEGSIDVDSWRASANTYEMADGIVINKADGNNIERAKLAQAQFRNALHLFPTPDSGWTPKVLTYSGFYGLGIKEIWDMIDEYFVFVKKNGYFDFRRNEQAKYWMYETINEHLRDSFYNNPTIETMLAAKEQAVLNGSQTSFVAAKHLLDTYFQLLK